MRLSILVSAVCLAVLVTSCSETTAPVDQSVESLQAKLFAIGTIVVRVHWEGQGLPGKRVELVELKKVATTDEEGFAEFVVPIGEHTVRAYEINRGGPAMWYIDTRVTVKANQATRVDVVDCLPCV
jgi:hypothetical protein